MATKVGTQLSRELSQCDASAKARIEALECQWVEEVRDTREMLEKAHAASLQEVVDASAKKLDEEQRARKKEGRDAQEVREVLEKQTREQLGAMEVLAFEAKAEHEGTKRRLGLELGEIRADGERLEAR